MIRELRADKRELVKSYTIAKKKRNFSEKGIFGRDSKGKATFSKKERDTKAISSFKNK